MAGGYLVAGFGSTYMGGNRHPTPFSPDDPKNAPWAAQIGQVKKFFTALEYWKLEPHGGRSNNSIPAPASESRWPPPPPAPRATSTARDAQDWVVVVRAAK